MFGLALQSGDSGKAVVKALEGILQAMFKLTQYIVATAPLFVTAILAWVISSQGYTLLMAMAKLIGVMYIGLFTITGLVLDHR